MKGQSLKDKATGKIQRTKSGAPLDTLSFPCCFTLRSLSVPAVSLYFGSWVGMSLLTINFANI